jgi:large subunit ribosomal protein L5
MQTAKDKLNKGAKELKEAIGTDNPMALPRLQKIVISTGVGKQNKEKGRVDLIANRLAKITGQKASSRGAKKSIASFKVREGDPVGLVVTLRGGRMHGFLEKLLHAVIPRIRDFRGYPESSVDEMGNLTIGLKEHTVFPETADEDLKDVFGLAITFTTTAADRAEALAFFRAINFPFKPDSAKIDPAR